MSETETLDVELRDSVGTASSRRLRKTGKIPAVLYGHGEENKHLAISEKQVLTAIRHHSKTVNLDGAVKDTALLSEIHYDPLGIDILHLDLVRVNLKEMVEVTVPIHLKGEAVGTKEGGMLLESVHELVVRCPAGAIPDAVETDVSELGVGQQLLASAIALPEGVELVTDASLMIAQVEPPKGAKGQEDSEEDDS